VISGVQAAKVRIAAAVASFLAIGSAAISASLQASSRSAVLRLESAGSRYVEVYADGSRGQVRVSHPPSAGEELVRQLDTALVLRSRSVMVDAGSGTPDIIVNCAADEIATGGGATWGAGSAARYWTAYSGPTENGAGWSAKGMNNTTASNVFRVFAICRKRLGGVSFVDSREGEG
jgi:hypothetical protein